MLRPDAALEAVLEVAEAEAVTETDPEFAAPVPLLESVEAEAIEVTDPDFAVDPAFEPVVEELGEVELTAAG